MALFDAHPWVRFFSGVLTGCWIGVIIGCAVALLFSGRRVRQLASANMVLRMKLRAREKPKRSAAPAGPVLVVPPSRRSSDGPARRVVNGGH